MLALASPFLIGRGVDVPDDAIHHTIANWEWLRYAWTQGVDPSFVPGKLGGVPLAADVVPMGPYYPGSWLLFFLPVWLALPVSALLHLIGTFFAMRWLGGLFGLSPVAASLAGASIAAGPLAVISLIDVHIDVLPIYLWFPVALGAVEAQRRASNRLQRLHWTLVAAAAIGLLLLGSHLRFSASACVAWGLWALIRRMGVGWIALVAVLGPLAGAPGYIPGFLAVTEASSGLNRLVALSGPVHETYNLWNLSGWFAPKPYWMERDFSLGTALGLSFLLGLPALRGSVRSLGLFALVLIGAALSPSIPGLRYLFAPLLLVSHPLDLVYGALALIPAAIAGARGLEVLVERPRVWMTSPLLRYALSAIALLILGRLLLPRASFTDAKEWSDWVLSLVQAGIVLWLLVRILVRQRQSQHRSPSSRDARLSLGLVAIVLLDLLLLGVRFHLAVPSANLQLYERAQGSDIELLGASYVDVEDMAELQGFLYDADAMEHVPTDTQRDAAEWVQGMLADRRWPLHLGPAHGIPSLSGRTKMPPRRSVAALSPLAEALREARMTDRDEEAVKPREGSATRALFAPGELGQRYLNLTGTEVAVDKAGVISHADDPLPTCWVPKRVEVLNGKGDHPLMEALGRSTAPGFDARKTVLLEAPSEGASPSGSPVVNPPASVDCADGVLQIQASAPTFVVLRSQWLQGRSLIDERGQVFTLIPANGLHSAVLVPPGQHRLEIRLETRGLLEAKATAGAAWALLALGLGLGLLLLRQAGAASP